MCASVEDISEVVIAEELDVLLVGDVEAVEEVVDVGLGELGGVLEGGQVGSEVVMLLNGFHDVAPALELEHLLGNHGVGVVKGHRDVEQVALVLGQVGGVAERALVVRHGPGGGGHHAQVVVASSVNGAGQGVLGGEVGAADYTRLWMGWD